MKVNPWTDEKDAEMRRLVALGHSARQIAEALGAPITRNSVIGRCFRAGLRLGAERVGRTPAQLQADKAMLVKFVAAGQSALKRNRLVRRLANAPGSNVVPIGFFGGTRHDSEAQSRKAAKSATLSKPVSLASFRRALPPAIAPAPDLDMLEGDFDIAAAVFSPASDPPAGVAMMDLQWRHCRWPLGDTKAVTTHFCGLDKQRGSYCEHHAQLAYTGTDAERRNEYRRQQRALRLEAAE